MNGRGRQSYGEAPTGTREWPCPAEMGRCAGADADAEEGGGASRASAGSGSPTSCWGADGSSDGAGWPWRAAARASPHVREGRTALAACGRTDREHPCDEVGTLVALGSQTLAPPKDRPAHVALGGVVGGRHASHRQEDPQRRPTDAQVVAQPGRFAIAATTTLLQGGAQALLDRGQRLLHRQPCRWRLPGCFAAASGAVDRQGRTVQCLAVAGGGVAALNHRLGIALQV